MMQYRYKTFGLLRYWLTVCLCVISSITLQAQPIENGITISREKIYLSLHRRISDIDLKQIVLHYELEELPLKQWLQGRDLEKMRQYGWTLDMQTSDWFVITKPLESIGDISKLEKKILIASQHQPGSELYPVGVYRKEFGYNQLRQPDAVVVAGQKVTFFLEGYKNAREVKIAGSFTQWENGAITMKKSGEGWSVTVNLEAGKHFYKFIADGNWMIHKDNLLKENDGQGNTNSVVYVTNQKFVLSGFQKASRVYVAGSFNGWSPKDAAMQKTSNGWELPVFLPEGTHTYRYVVDNRWMEDPGNGDKLRNEFGEYNSVLRIGKPFIFRLDGFNNAKQVMLVGSFNGWRNNELYLQQREGGWEISYTIGAGNHEYYYLVDGSRLGRKPSGDKPSEPLNFNTVVLPNHTFSLKGYDKATTVYLSGSFNNWSKTGFPMTYENGEWRIKMNLPPGKQTYKFVVDGKWMIDPANPLWESNEQGTKNSVLWLDLANG